MDSIKSSRSASIIIITCIYVMAAFIGVVSYLYLPYPFWLSLLIADVIATVFVFAFSMIFKMLLYMIRTGVCSR